MDLLPSMIQHYLDSLEYERKLSPHTIKAYRIDLRQFAAFVGDEPVDQTLLRQYIKHLNQTFSPRSAKRKVASVRAFYRTMLANRKLETDPFDHLIIRIHTPKQLPRVIPEETVHTLLQRAYDSYRTSDRWVLRDIFTLELLFSTGLRVSELCSLTATTFFLHENRLTLTVLGKGSKERTLQISTEELVSLAHLYCAEFEHEIRCSNRILINNRGNCLSPQSVRRIIDKYAQIAGISMDLTPHMFRHTFATSLLDAGVDIRYIQTMLGHSSISTTQIYTYVSTQQQAVLLAQNHPRSKMSFSI